MSINIMIITSTMIAVKHTFLKLLLYWFKLFKYDCYVYVNIMGKSSLCKKNDKTIRNV